MGDKFRFIEFNVGILFISSSAVLGRYITLDSTQATWWRCLIACITLWLLSLIVKESLSFNWRAHGKVMLITSAMMAAHWTAYFYSLDYSNVSVALMTLYTFPAFTAIIEPLVLKKRIPWKDIMLAVITLGAIYVIAPPFSVSSDMNLAIGLGLFSSLMYSLRNIWITTITPHYSGTTIMTYQMGLMALFLSVAFIWRPIDLVEIDWVAILILGIVTTAFGHTLFMRGLGYYQATTASILASIVPVYAISLGYLILDEVPSIRTLVGGSVILAIVLVKAMEKKPIEN